jgi:hypothetical protein
VISLKNFQNYIGICSEILICLGIILGFLYLGMNFSFFQSLVVLVYPIGIYFVILALCISAVTVVLTWFHHEDLLENFHFSKYLQQRRVILALLTIVICLSTIPLITSWSLAEFHQNNVGGLFPIFDAGAYYGGAEHILDTGHLDAWNQRRPLSSMFLATRLLLTNFDFRSTLILQAMIVGAGIFLAALTVSQTFGKSAGFLMFAVLFVMSSFFLPDNLSESLGIIFGCISFCLIWLGIFRQNFISYLFGLFFLMIGFMIRPGPLLLFPALVLLAGTIFSDENGFNWKKTFLSCVPLGIGILFNQVIIWLYGDGRGLFMGNYATVFYGLAAGGKGWQQSILDFPNESANLPESQLAPILYQKSFEMILANPMQFLKAVFNGYVSGPYDTVVQFYHLITGYSVNPVFNQLGFTIFLIVFICILTGCIRFFLYSDLKYVKILCLYIIITTFLALPFFFTDGGIRTLVIIFPYFAISIIIGIIGWRSKPMIRKNITPEKINSLYAFKLPVIIGILILVSSGMTLAFGPVFNQVLLGQHPEISPQICKNNETYFIMRVDQGIPYLELIDAADTNRSFAPHVRASDFSSPNERYYLSYYYELTDFIDGKDLPVVFRGYDRQYHETKIILAPYGILGEKHQDLGFCAQSNNLSRLPPYMVYKLNTSSVNLLKK